MLLAKSDKLISKNFMKESPRFSRSDEALAWYFLNAEEDIDFHIYPGLGMSEYYLSTLLLQNKRSLRYRVLVADAILPIGFRPSVLFPRTIPESAQMFSYHGWEVRVIQYGKTLGEILPIYKEFLIFDKKILFSSENPIIASKPQDPPAVLNGTEIDKNAAIIYFNHVWDRAKVFTDEESEYKPKEQDLIALALFGNKIKLVALNQDGNYRFLDEEQNLHRIIYIESTETLSLQRAVDELEDLINNPYANEGIFQQFFERNPELILNDMYSKAHPHVILTTNEKKSLIPDFVLEPIDQNFLCDLLELKLPSAPVFIRKKNRLRFSAAVLEARAQLLEYSRFFNEQKNQDAVYERYGLRAWMPKMFLIIGRLGTINPFERRIIESSQPDIYLRTYDDLVNWTKAKIERMKRKT